MITYVNEVPSVEAYLFLRDQCLTAKTVEAASKGLPNSLFSIIAQYEGRTIGMGRVVGDGGLNFEIVDIAVLPEFQGRGIGKEIMHRIMQYLELNAPNSAYISLMADVPKLYEQFGFKLSRPKTEGMYLISAHP